jgi:nucleotide-binding universal stress UspA family protein
MTTTDHTGRIIVGTDGTPTSRPATEWARQEALVRGIGLDVVMAWHAPRLTFTDGGLGAADSFSYRIDAWAALEGAIDDLVERAAGVDLRAVPVEGKAAEVLIERSQGAAMLVVGARRRHLAALRPGSVSRRCVLHARCPVVVVPPGWSPSARITTVVVGVDGSPGSAHALRWAADTASAHGAALDVVHGWNVIPPSDPTGLGFAFDRDVIAKESEALLDEMADDVLGPDRARPATVRLLPVDNHPVDALCAAARPADLLVVGSAGHGGFARALLGSVAEQCLHRAPCPIAVIGPWARRAS